MLIDAYLPEYDVSERHRTHVNASRDVTYAALRTTDLAGAPIVRLLLLLRGLPSALGRGTPGIRELWERSPEPITLASFEQQGFRVLEEMPPNELVIGLEGQFWRPSGNLCTPAAETFRNRAVPAGTARAAWNFSLETQPDGSTELSTETRVRCADSATRRRFLPYWYAIRAGSVIIRHSMLRANRRTAEATHVPPDDRPVQPAVR
jgi:hypothetical protein